MKKRKTIEKTPKKIGRPTLFSEKIVTEICERLSNGEPLAQICRDGGMPAYQTVWDWQQKNQFVSGSIARAREHGEDVIAANLRLTARNKGESTNDVQRDKLIIETDLKLLAKWNPKKYGERQSVDVSGNLSLGQLVRESMKPDA